MLTDKEAILQRWSEHFKGLLSNQSTLCESSLAKIPKVDVKLELDDPPTREAIKKVTMQLKVDKSSGIDGIPAEVYQHGGEAVLDKLQICSPTVGKQGLDQRTSGMQSLSLSV